MIADDNVSAVTLLAELLRMRPGSFLVNIARGTLVDEELAANQDRIAPMIELFKAVQLQIAPMGALAPAARMPLLTDLLTLLDARGRPLMTLAAM